MSVNLSLESISSLNSGSNLPTNVWPLISWLNLNLCQHYHMTKPGLTLWPLLLQFVTQWSPIVNFSSTRRKCTLLCNPKTPMIFQILIKLHQFLPTKFSAYFWSTFADFRKGVEFPAFYCERTLTVSQARKDSLFSTQLVTGRPKPILMMCLNGIHSYIT